MPVYFINYTVCTWWKFVYQWHKKCAWAERSFMTSVISLAASIFSVGEIPTCNITSHSFLWVSTDTGMFWQNFWLEWLHFERYTFVVVQFLHPSTDCSLFLIYNDYHLAVLLIFFSGSYNYCVPYTIWVQQIVWKWVAEPDRIRYMTGLTNDSFTVLIWFTYQVCMYSSVPYVLQN